MEKIIPEFNELISLNSSSEISSFDYFSFILSIARNKKDISNCVFEIFFPKFEFFHKKIFNTSFNCYNKYKENIKMAFLNVNHIIGLT